MNLPLTHCLVGCGQVFDLIAAEPQVYAANVGWEVRPAMGVEHLASTANDLLSGIERTTTRIFIAVDAQALNYARLELYGIARMAGLQMATLVHPLAWVAPGVRLADNVWLGPGVRVTVGCQIDSDVLINVGARLDERVHVSAHGWIGPGASLGAGVNVGTHSAVGADVHVRAGVQIGRHCTIDHAGIWTRDLKDGSFLEPELPTVAQIIGAGYSFQKKQYA
jgi:hypothetical protein